MAIEDTRMLRSTNNEQTANELLGQGWTLLQVQPMSEGNDQWTRYQLGWQQAGEPAPEGAAPPLSIGAHATQP